jgi:hypothetical protein
MGTSIIKKIQSIERKNMKITVEQIKSWKPCPLYTPERIKKLIGEGKTPLEISELKIPIPDIFWVLLRPEIINQKSLYLLACDFAEHVLFFFKKVYPKDTLIEDTLKAKRLWIEGKLSMNDLSKNRYKIIKSAWKAWSVARAANWTAETRAMAMAAASAMAAVADAADASAIEAARAAAAAARAASKTAWVESKADEEKERKYQLDLVKKVLAIWHQN